MEHHTSPYEAPLMKGEEQGPQEISGQGSSVFSLLQCSGRQYLFTARLRVFSLTGFLIAVTLITTAGEVCSALVWLSQARVTCSCRAAPNPPLWPTFSRRSNPRVIRARWAASATSGSAVYSPPG
jgi:hypothetical protein